MANENGVKRSDDYYTYLPVNKAMRTLTDDKRGKIGALLRAQREYPEAQYYITAQKWGRYAITVYVVDQEGIQHVFTFGRSVEGFVIFTKTDKPDDMHTVSKKDVPHVAHIFEMLAATIDAQLADLVERPQITFE